MMRGSKLRNAVYYFLNIHDLMEADEALLMNSDLSRLLNAHSTRHPQRLMRLLHNPTHH
jgi:hypothetical protein